MGASPPSPFAGLGLSAPLLTALREANYAAPTPIQAAAIPAMLAGRDVLGVAQTGSGKTAAFALPLLQRLAEVTPRPQRPAALVLAPTRELAAQTAASFRRYGEHLEIRCELVVGGVDIAEQIQALRHRVHVLVATPGRLLDLLQKKRLRLADAGFVVFDEADRMLDMGFLGEVTRILRQLPRSRQSALFSATFPAAIGKLAAELLDAPERFEIDASATPVPDVDQRVYFVATKDKRHLLADVLLDPAIRKALVFTRAKHTANAVARHLRELGLTAEAMHGNKSQDLRSATLKAFTKGRVRVLVASDLAARGLDVADITHVFNYDLPDSPEVYVHRIGRTARAGRSGVALSFCDPEYRKDLERIEAATGRSIEVVQDHPFAVRSAPRRRGPRRRR